MEILELINAAFMDDVVDTHGKNNRGRVFQPRLQRWGYKNITFFPHLQTMAIKEKWSLQYVNSMIHYLSSCCDGWKGGGCHVVKCL